MGGNTKHPEVRSVLLTKALELSKICRMMQNDTLCIIRQTFAENKQGYVSAGKREDIVHLLNNILANRKCANLYSNYLLNY